MYFGVAVEANPALPLPVDPDNLTLTYWFVNDPESTVTLSYSRDRHESNWKYLRDLVLAIDDRVAINVKWPLTDNVYNCRRCAYQVLYAKKVGKLEFSDWGVEDYDVTLEPELP